MSKTKKSQKHNQREKTPKSKQGKPKPFSKEEVEQLANAMFQTNGPSPEPLEATNPQFSALSVREHGLNRAGLIRVRFSAPVALYERLRTESFRTNRDLSDVISGVLFQYFGLPQ